MKGIVVKAYNSYYYVQAENGREVPCRLRGKFKKGRFSLLVGDHVVFQDVPEDGSDEQRLADYLRPRDWLAEFA